MTVPFDYPPVPHVRGPARYAGYESYRPWLRDEFAFRCVYRLMRDGLWHIVLVLEALSSPCDHYRRAAR